MLGRLAAMRRHPVKGFTPERLSRAALVVGDRFPGDRLWAVENGPSGFDPARPAHVPKMRLAVLAAVPELARVRTALDDAAGVLHAEAPGREPFLGRLADASGRAEFAGWLESFLQAAAPDALRGPLRLIDAPGHAFMDDPRGAVSVVNLASVRDLGERLGVSLDPSRFRANLYVEGWPAWAELAAPEGARLRLGGAECAVIMPIRRCAAIHVDPLRGVRDLELVASLRSEYGHMFCGLYLRVEAGGLLAEGDPAELEA